MPEWLNAQYMSTEGWKHVVSLLIGVSSLCFLYSLARLEHAPWFKKHRSARIRNHVFTLRFNNQQLKTWPKTAEGLLARMKDWDVEYANWVADPYGKHSALHGITEKERNEVTPEYLNGLLKAPY